jgi:hypothetical protein
MEWKKSQKQIEERNKKSREELLEDLRSVGRGRIFERVC